MRRLAVAAALSLAGAPALAADGIQGSLRQLLASGGRVAWHHGPAHERIAYDAIVDDERKNTELFVMEPDGTGRRCVTCDAPIPRGFIGQPAWHPDGEWLIVQAESGSSGHTFYNHLAWGFDNDLWMIRADGVGAHRVWETPPGHAALHPHFNADGSRLVFSERAPTGRQRLFLRRLTPGGENQWTGWRIHLASVRFAEGRWELSGHRTLQPNGPGFYETHGFMHDGRLLYSYTARGAYVDDCFIAEADGSRPRNLTNSPRTWEEHGTFSPDGRRYAFMSSRDTGWRAPASPKQLRTELYVRAGAGAARQLTRFNAERGEAMVVSDFDWDRTGRRIVLQAVPFGTFVPEIWLLELPEGGW